MIELSQYFQSIRSRKQEGIVQIFCSIRKRWLIAQPEEYVRQAAILHLRDLGYSHNLISVEQEIKVHQVLKRYDIVVWSKSMTPLILVECKAPEVAISSDTWEQVGTYNLHLDAECVWITNGHTNRIFLYNRRTNSIQIVKSLPLPTVTEGKMSENQKARSISESWSYDHFIGFLLLYAAHADYEYSTSEEEHIQSLISPKILQEVEVAFNAMGEFEQLQSILDWKEQFITTSEDKKKVLEALSRLFKSDGDYSKLEANLYDFLKRLL